MGEVGVQCNGGGEEERGSEGPEGVDEEARAHGADAGAGEEEGDDVEVEESEGGNPACEVPVEADA
eukprot:2193222-Rhodomonas_salina.1